MSDRVPRSYVASLDPLTGLYDIQTIKLRVVEELARARRYGYPVSFLFALFQGPEMRLIEDRVQQLADLLERRVRGSDVLSRCGTDCLALVLPHTDEAGVRCLSERIYRLATVMQLPSGLGGQPLPVRMGSATIHPEREEDGGSVMDSLAEQVRCQGVGVGSRNSVCLQTL